MDLRRPAQFDKDALVICWGCVQMSWALGWLTTLRRLAIQSPYAKGADHLSRFEAKTEDELARAQLAGIALLLPSAERKGQSPAAGLARRPLQALGVWTFSVLIDIWTLRGRRALPPAHAFPLEPMLHLPNCPWRRMHNAA